MAVLKIAARDGIYLSSVRPDDKPALIEHFLLDVRFYGLLKDEAARKIPA